jgi:hypothetical protein
MSEMRMEQFTWRGEPIPDIRAWALARGEPMVRYHAERTVPSPWVPWELVKEEYDGTMPESFWSGLHRAHGWRYTETGREDA